MVLACSQIWKNTEREEFNITECSKNVSAINPRTVSKNLLNLILIRKNLPQGIALQMLQNLMLTIDICADFPTKNKIIW